MEQNKELKLSICYSHQDNLEPTPYIEQFKKHTAPLEDNGLVGEWYDREILAGVDYQHKIDNNLDDADIICLFISANFLSSDNCKKEKKKALELRERRGVLVIPIILSPCGWLDDKEISKLLALPRDGKPVSSFQDLNEAWHGVYNGLRNVIEKEMTIRQLEITEEFKSFLQDTEMLTKAHSQKERVLLDDVFICPELDNYGDLREYEGRISAEELLEDLLGHPKILIAGEGQSGKTALCKMIFKELRKKNFIPVYVSDKRNQFRGKIENKILSSFREQYESFDIDKIDEERIIPIIDDFHLAKNREKHIEDLSKYSYCIVIVDDIFSFNIKDEKLITSFAYFKIRELKASLRYELIKKWVCLTDKETRDNYKRIDKTTELIDFTLGKIIGKGIMPAYPFFILSAIVAHETFMPLNQEITSQGYCYQALIYFYLRKMGVKNDEIDIYINLLTEMAFYSYREKKYELSPDDFASFMNSYLERYTLPIKQEILLKNLGEIISVDSFNNYSFRHLYLYYFFVAKYLAEHAEDSGTKKEIEQLMSNLHVNENGYIAVFMAHHSKNIRILDEIKQNALHLFDKYKPATLSKDEVKFFDERADIIVKAVLPPANTTPEKERAERLEVQDEIEQSQEDEEQEDDMTNEDSFEIELRRAIKTVEVMGCIIKTRVGSLEKTQLEEMFEEGMNVHLRIMSSFFRVIENEENQRDIVDFVSERLGKIVEKRETRLSSKGLEKISRSIFWNVNFFTVFFTINKIVRSLGSDKLTEITNKVCDKVNAPVSFTVKHGILMWYNKNLRVDEIVRRMGEKDFSKIAEKVVELMVVNHCSLHPTSYQDRQRIEKSLGVPKRKLLTRYHKKS